MINKKLILMILILISFTFVMATNEIYVNKNTNVNYASYIAFSSADTLYCNNLTATLSTLSYNWYIKVEKI